MSPVGKESSNNGHVDEARWLTRSVNATRICSLTCISEIKHVILAELMCLTRVVPRLRAPANPEKDPL